MRKTRDKVMYRRKRTGATDYRKRLALLKAETPRLVVRKSSRSILIQLVEYKENGDHVLVSARGTELAKLGWNYSTSSVPASYLVGYLAGKKMLAKGYKKTVLDIGLQARGERVFAALKGCVDAGVQVPSEDKVFPAQERISGAHIRSHQAGGMQYSAYSKKGLKKEDIDKVFAQVKEKIK